MRRGRGQPSEIERNARVRARLRPGPRACPDRGSLESGCVTVLAVLVACLASLAARPLSAQEVALEIEPGPYHQGQPIALHVVATQFEPEPTPEIDFEQAEGISLALLGVSPETSTSITIVNGQMSRVHEVRFTYRYELTSRDVGRVTVPAFRVRQAGTERRTEPLVLDVASVPSSEEIGISVVLPEGPIFVGQKVPVVVEFRIDQSVVSQIVDYRVHVPLFDRPGLRFIDSKPVGANSQLQIVTPKGRFHLAAVQEEREVAGRPSTILRAERILVASKPGRIEADAPAVAVERATRFRQDFFGGRQPAQTARMLAAGRRVSLEVAELPSAGRPPSFAGAVGSDFSFEVTADRSVVQLGEPIELNFHVRGRGDLAAAGLPPLDAEGLFDPSRFRLPEEAPAGVVDADGKHFRAKVRVLDASVREIPPLAYSYFDARTRRFETVRSQPIALSISAAQIVGADAVASGAGDPLAAGSAAGGALGGGSESAAVGASEAMGGGSDSRAGDETARASSLAERSANLAVERDADVLLRGARLGGGSTMPTVALYGVGLALLGLAIFDRRRRALDPRLRARRLALEEAGRAIEAALAAGHADGAGALGRALREWVAARPDEASPAVDALLAECDALRFAPSPGAASAVGGSGAAGAGGARRGASVPESLAQQARALVAARLAEIEASARADRPDSDRAGAAGSRSTR